MKKNRIVWLAGLIVVAGGIVAAGGLSRGSMATSGNDDGQPVDIDVTAIELPRSQPPLHPLTRFRGGWVLTSEHPEFGGFSGLLIDAEAGQLLAISDEGNWWRAPFDSRQLQAPGTGTMQGYAPGVAADKTDLDAESLIRFGDGLLVSFEQNHRLEFMPEVGAKPIAPPGLAPIDFAGVSNNSGMEAITLLPSGSLLVFIERGLSSNGLLKARLVSSESVEDLAFRPPVNFAPTDAATLPNGDVLVLLRHYSAIDGVAVKVHHIRANDITAGAVLSGDEILHLTPEFSVDNMEGLDVVPLDGSTVRLVMISDDNFNPLQRTLLMMFDYEYQ